MSKIYVITRTANHTTGHGQSDDSIELSTVGCYGPLTPAFKTRSEAQAYIDRDQAKGIGKSQLWEPGITELTIA